MPLLPTIRDNPFDRIEKDSDRDYWMTSQEALDYGMIDKVLINEKKK
jgi:ATP-dependent Clp protease protease subunit